MSLFGEFLALPILYVRAASRHNDTLSNVNILPTHCSEPEIGSTRLQNESTHAHQKKKTGKTRGKKWNEIDFSVVWHRFVCTLTPDTTFALDCGVAYFN